MTDERALRAGIVAACRRLDERGLVAGPDGNVSARLGAGTLLVTPSGTSKGALTPDDLIVVDVNGAVVRGRGSPSSELRMHLRIYAHRADVQAVVHAHPPVATGFAVAGQDFMAPVLPEVILQMGGVPLVPYGTPGTDELPDRLEPFLASHDAFLLANHGATTVGPTLQLALHRMESLEHAARILLAARSVGNVRELGPDQAARLRAAYEALRQDVPPQAGEREG